jgi:hypothetical protein
MNSKLINTHNTPKKVLHGLPSAGTLPPRKLAFGLPQPDEKAFNTPIEGQPDEKAVNTPIEGHHRARRILVQPSPTPIEGPHRAGKKLLVHMRANVLGRMRIRPL